jgi:hypothetical protein
VSGVSNGHRVGVTRFTQLWLMAWRCLSMYIHPYFTGTLHVFGALWNQTPRPLRERIYAGVIDRLAAAASPS